MKQVKLWLPLPPSVNQMYKPTKKGVRLSKEARAYKEQVGWLINQLEPIAGTLSLYVSVNAHNKSRDLDNCLKLIQDSLEGFVFLNDRQIVDIEAYMHHVKQETEGVYIRIKQKRPQNWYFTYTDNDYGIISND